MSDIRFDNDNMTPVDLQQYKATFRHSATQIGIRQNIQSAGRSLSDRIIKLKKQARAAALNDQIRPRI